MFMKYKKVRYYTMNNESKYESIIRRLERLYPEHKVFALDAANSELSKAIYALSKEEGFESKEAFLNSIGFEIISGEQIKELRPNPICKPGEEPEAIKSRFDNALRLMNEYYPNKHVVGSIGNDHKSIAGTLSFFRQYLGYDDVNSMLAAYDFHVEIAKAGRPSSDFDAMIDALKKKYDTESKPTSIGQLQKENPEFAGSLKTMQNKAKQLFGMSAKQYLLQEGILYQPIVKDEIKPAIIEKPVNVTTEAQLPKKEKVAVATSTIRIEDINHDEFDIVIENDTITITKYYGKESIVIVPARMSEIPVRKIGKRAFWGNEDLQKLIISEGIQEIDDYSIMNNTNLTCISMPKSICKIGEYFSCNIAKNNTLTKDCVIYVKDNSYVQNFFLNLNSFVQPDHLLLSDGYSELEIVSMNQMKFEEVDGTMRCICIESNTNHKKLDVYIPKTFQGKSVTEVLLPSSNFLKFYIPSSVKSIRHSNKFDSLEYNNLSLEIDFQNPFYCLKNHMLLSKDETILYAYLNRLSEGMIPMIYVPDSVRVISKHAFVNVHANTLHLPKELFSIDQAAFVQCFIKSMVGVKEVKYLHPQAFVDCENKLPLVKIENKRLINYMDYIEDEVYSIPEGVQTICTGSFKNKYLKKLILPSSLKVIEEKAFFEMDNLEEIVFNEGLEKIGDCAFVNCGSIKKITLPSSLKSIGQCAFSNNDNLNVIIPESVSDFDLNAFSEKTLETIQIQSEYVYEFEDGLFSKDRTILYRLNLREENDEVHIPESVRFLKGKAISKVKINKLFFDGEIEFFSFHCIYKSNIKELHFSPNQKSISFKCFNSPGISNRIFNCSIHILNLNQMVDIPDACFKHTSIHEIHCSNSLKTIGKEAFYWCGLHTFTIPESVGRIGDFAFAHNRFASIKLPKKLKSLGNHLLDGNLSSNHLTQITVYDQITNLKSLDNIRFNSENLVISDEQVHLIIRNSLDDFIRFELAYYDRDIYIFKNIFTNGYNIDFTWLDRQFMKDRMYTQMTVSKIPYALMRLMYRNYFPTEKEAEFIHYLKSVSTDAVEYVIRYLRNDYLELCRKYNLIESLSTPFFLDIAKTVDNQNAINFFDNSFGDKCEEDESVDCTQYQEILNFNGFANVKEEAIKSFFLFNNTYFRGPWKLIEPAYNDAEKNGISVSVRLDSEDNLVSMWIDSNYFIPFMKRYPSLKATCLKAVRYGMVALYSESGYYGITDIKGSDGLWAPKEDEDPDVYHLGIFSRTHINHGYVGEVDMNLSTDYVYPFREKWFDHNYVFIINEKYYEKLDKNYQGDSIPAFLKPVIFDFESKGNKIDKFEVPIPDGIYAFPEQVRSIEMQRAICYLFSKPENLLLSHEQLSGTGMMEHIAYFWNLTTKEIAALYLFQKSKRIQSAVAQRIVLPYDIYFSEMISLLKQDYNKKYIERASLFVKEHEQQLSQDLKLEFSMLFE